MINSTLKTQNKSYQMRLIKKQVSLQLFWFQQKFNALYNLIYPFGRQRTYFLDQVRFVDSYDLRDVNHAVFR